MGRTGNTRKFLTDRPVVRTKVEMPGSPDGLCMAASCGAPISNGKTMCATHWEKVPEHLRQRVQDVTKRARNGEPGALDLYRRINLKAIASLTETSNYPRRFRGGLERYFNDHIETGSFLRAILENDLILVVRCADPISKIELGSIVQALIEEAPPQAWGSKEAVAKWLEKGGGK